VACKISNILIKDEKQVQYLLNETSSEIKSRESDLLMLARRDVVPGKRYVGQTIPSHCNELQYTEQDCKHRYLPLNHTQQQHS